MDPGWLYLAGLVFVVLWIVAIMDAARSRRCPYCVRKIHRDATRCPWCTSDLSAPEAKAASEKQGRDRWRLV